MTVSGGRDLKWTRPGSAENVAIMMFRRFVACVLAVFSVTALRADDAAPGLVAGANEAVQAFPPIKLRAYGTLSGQLKTFTNASQPVSQPSVLLINCDSVPKAQLVLAKYLSDLGEMPGVTTQSIATPRGQVAARQIDAQGMVLAVRCGQQVYVLTSADGTGLNALLAANLPAGAKIDASEAEIPVPMYVDRWDKYGFRFYYGPFTRQHDNEAYDPRQDFTFADQTGKDGLILWNGPFHAPTAENVMNTPSVDWVYRGALKLQLPLGINLGITDDNLALVNRFADQAAPDSECYLGGWYYESPVGTRTISWASPQATDAALGQLKSLVVDFSQKYPNIVNWLEPHEEMAHGVADMLDDHGPGATRAFRDWMKSRFGTPDAVAKRWGMQAGSYASWDAVPYPELATFFGWGPDALDLEGQWKISFDAPYDVDSAQPTVDDSTWPSIGAYHNTVLRLLPRKKAVLRRHIVISPAWKAAHPKVFFNLFDLENTLPKKDMSPAQSDVFVFVNGKAIPEDESHRSNWHWSHLDITSALKDGDNQITILLPMAWIDYRCFLAGEDYGTYPDLKPPGMNAMWADFTDFISWSRAQSVRRGMQMIRQVDPDRPITVMSPGLYWADTKYACEDYGGILHDTGGMAGFWNDYNPVIAKGIGLPTDCEPGSGAVDLDDFKRFMGRWSTDDTQGVDYFQHIGDVMWKPEVKDYFQKTLALWHLIGKDHTPFAQIGILDSARVPQLFGYPWNGAEHSTTDADLILGSGMWSYPWQGWLQNSFPRAAITEQDFARGNADEYKIVIDTNTTIMDPPVVDAIADWVKKGGIFVTYMQTGRHTSTEANSWPISKLTGYAVTSVNNKPRHMDLVAGQTFFHTDTPDWAPENNSQGGLTLQKQDPSCVDLATWDDGTVAVGMRRLGKGMVINLGNGNPNPLVGQILEGLKFKHVAGTASSGDVILRHFVSNNGLYDVWSMWNQQGHPVTTDVTFHDGLVPVACHDLNTLEGIPIDTSDPAGAKLTNIALDSWQTRVLLTARNQLAQAPAEWFNLQRHWWKGTADPGPVVPIYKPRVAVDLSKDWAFKALPTVANAPEDPSLADPAMDDSKWPRADLGVFNYPDNQDVQHAVFRKKFTVPADWNKGKVFLFGKADTAGSGGLRRYLDGKPMQNGPVLDDAGGVLTPGSTHLLTFELWGAGVPLGEIEPAWILYQPTPLSTQAVTDGWSFASDFMTYSDPNSLPAVTPGAGAIRTEVVIDPKQQGHNIVLHVEGNNASISGLIFNGQFYPSYGNIYPFIDVNVTPWVKFGQKNEIIVPLGGPVTVQDVSLNFYEKDSYP
jgi:hypothetical protein